MLESYSGATELIPILGDPIKQVKAPGSLTRIFEQHGHDLLVVPVRVSPASIRTALTALGTFVNVRGLIATVPHKFVAFEHASDSSARARFLRSANVLRREGDGWRADMLDGLGFVHALSTAGYEPAGRRALLLGAGGAGSAIGYELLQAGALHVAVHDADKARKATLLDKLGGMHFDRVSAGSPSPVGFDLVVNATTSGMRAGDPLPLAVGDLRPETFVGDVVTNAEPTPLIRAAGERGCRTLTGADMFDAVARLMLSFFTAGDA